MSFQAQPLVFEANGLYLLLSDRGDSFTFHWEIYVAKTPHSGPSYHLTNQTGDGNWVYESKPNENVFHTRHIIVAVKLAVLDPVLHDPLGECLAGVHIGYSTRFHEEMTCRVWAKEALFALDDQGYINIAKDVDAVEKDALMAAMINRQQLKQTVISTSAVKV